MTLTSWWVTALVILLLICTGFLVVYRKRQLTYGRKQKLYTETANLLDRYTRICSELLDLFNELYGQMKTENKEEIFFLVDEKESERLMVKADGLFQQLAQVDFLLKGKIKVLTLIADQPFLTALEKFPIQENVKQIIRKDLEYFLLNAPKKTKHIQHMMKQDLIRGDEQNI